MVTARSRRTAAFWSETIWVWIYTNICNDNSQCPLLLQMVSWGSLGETFVRKSCFIHWYFCSYEISAIVCICWNKHEWDRQYTFHCRGRGLPQGQALMCCFHPTIPLRLGRWMLVYRYRHPWILRKCRLTFQSHPPPASRAHFRLRCRDFNERKTCNEWGYFLKTHESSICSSCGWLNQFRTTITGGLIIICH